ncbi:WAP, Kazal, immunoglobulin, Kunitz and NTR domain-containing protein 1 [Ixodes scapularis]|uniref:Putative salivary kunitz domain protein n=1 Tax=Ixodes scapularis TaxID=6945 RepID=A0A4D5RTF7_IXOSC|nr:WAP, Kazal, immunoglobulin, Kunitz and NTR domain-containing protein 1 [Ixodes scapularis]
MAANFSGSSKAMLLLVLCFAVVCHTVNAGAQHVCPYPQACTSPGAPDPHHTVTATARYDPTTGECVTIPSVTGPHDCQKFASLAACQAACVVSE